MKQPCNDRKVATQKDIMKPTRCRWLTADPLSGLRLVYATCADRPLWMAATALLNAWLGRAIRQLRHQDKMISPMRSRESLAGVAR